MININRSSLLPSIHSFHYSIPLTSTPKRSNKSYCSQPLSSTLTISNDSCKKMDLSISAITFIKKSSSRQKKGRRYYHRRRTHVHSSKRIELKYLLYSTRVTKPKQYLHLIVDDITTAKALFSLSHCLNIKTVLNPQENLAIFTNHISPMVDHISFFASKA